MALPKASVADITADVTLSASKSKIKGNFDDLLTNDNYLNDNKADISPKVKFTAEGGIAIKLTNKTGAPSVKGTIVRASTTTDNAFMTAPANSDEAIGIVYDNAVADAAECWIVKDGIAEVLLKDGTACTHGDWAGVSDAAGRAYASTEPAAAAGHDLEIGHFIESKGAGSNVLAKLAVHFR